MIGSVNEWLGKWEPIWLFSILFIETFIGFLSLKWLIKEYYYDAEKDIAKKQRKTRTTKKTSESKDGSKIVEETTEVTEPTQEDKPK